MIWIGGKLRDGYSHNVAFNSGGGSSGTTTQQSIPWAGVQPFLSDQFSRAQGLSNQPMSYFPGATVAPQAQQTTDALAMTEARARNGSPVMNQANSTLLGTLRGDYLDPASNPGFQTMVDRTKAAVLPAINGQFGAAGRSGSGLAARAAGMGLGDAIGQLAYQNYGDERQRQMQGMLFAPQAAQSDYTDAQMLATVGAQNEDNAQQQINDQVARFNFAQMEPWQRLQLFSQITQPGLNFGTTTGTQTAPRSNRLAGGIGGGLGGAATGAMVGSVVPGIGTAVGAGVGGLLGLLGGSMA